jgi:succinate dehydrogenase/fumarate reductase flavoprotein subunit
MVRSSYTARSGLFYAPAAAAGCSTSTTTPQVSGDGYVLGFRAGVPLFGIEMIDFQAMCCSPRELFGFAPHPTAFLNGGAVFRNPQGGEFLHDEEADLLEREALESARTHLGNTHSVTCVRAWNRAKIVN